MSASKVGEGAAKRRARRRKRAQEILLARDAVARLQQAPRRASKTAVRHADVHNE